MRNTHRNPVVRNLTSFQFGWFNLVLDLFFEGIVNLWTRMADLAWVTCYILGTLGAGRVTSSNLDGSTYVQTHILRRFQIQRGKFKFFTVVPNMDKSVGAGWVTFSNLNGSTFVQTQILRRFQIWRGKLKIFTVAPNMNKLLMGIRRVLGDLLQFGWFNLCLDPSFEEIPDPKREI
jgi:hypothetical protein